MKAGNFSSKQLRRQREALHATQRRIVAKWGARRIKDLRGEICGQCGYYRYMPHRDLTRCQAGPSGLMPININGSYCPYCDYSGGKN